MTHRSRLRALLLAHTTPFGKRTVIIDFEDLLSALDDFWFESFREFVADVCAEHRDTHPDG